MPKLEKNLWKLCWYHALAMSLFPMAVITIFWKEEIDLSMAEIMLLMGYFGGVVAVFEFPSGYLADRLGYRKTLLLACISYILGWTCYFFADSLSDLLVTEALLGLSLSLVSGCDTAMMFETLKGLDKEREFTKWNGRFVFMGQTGEGTAALLAGVFYLWWARLPFLIEILAWIVNLFLVLSMVEPDRTRPKPQPHWDQVKELLHHLFVDQRYLRKMIIFSILIGMSSFIPVWTIQSYAKDSGVPIPWLGPMWAVANFMVAFGALWADRIRANLGINLTIGLCIVFVAIGYFGLGLTHAVWGFAFYFFITFMRGVNGPVLSHLQHKLIPSENRAGMMSVKSLLFRTTFVIAGPLVGFCIDRWNQHDVMLAVGFAATVVLAWGLWDLRHYFAEQRK